MANEVNIDRLSIEIQANAEPAAKGIGDLASAVKKFNSAIAGSKGFGDLVNLANASKTASDNMQDAPNRLRELASALNEISQSMKGLRIPSDLSKGLSEIGASARSIGANVGQRLQSLAAGLSALRDVGNVRISSSVGSGINAINEALANLNVNNLSRIDRFVESVRQLESINNLTISASLAREITNIAEAAELVGEVDFAPLRDIGNAIAHLAVANDIHIGNHLAENIVNLGVAVQEVQGTDWTEFERMAEGLRHLEGLGQIRIPRMPGVRAARHGGGNNGNGVPTGNASEQTDLDGIANATDDATEGAENLNDELTNTNQLLQNALGAAQNFARQFAGGFVQGAGLGGLVTQLQQVFSSPGNAIGYGLGATIQFAVRQIGNLASAFKNLGIKAFTASINALRTALHGIGSAAAAAGKGLVSLGKMGARGLAGIAKIEFKGLMALPTLFGSALRDKIASITKGIGGFVRSLGRIAFYRAIRTAIKEVTKAFSEGVGNLYQWSLLVDRTFANSMDKIATSMQYLKNSLGAMVSPIINTLAPVIDFVVDKIVDGINLVNQFLAAITGNDTYTAAKKVATEWAESEAATDGAKKNLKEIKKTILGFDELNILNKDTDNGSSSSGSKKKTPDYRSMFETRPIESVISDFAKKVREAFESGEWTQLGAMFADKLNGWVDAIDWLGIGKKLGDGLNIIIDVYNGFMDTVDWFGLGDNLADGINSFMDSVDWYELGRALTQHIDALFTVLGGFVEKFDWFKAGESLSDAVFGMFEGIDWDRAGIAIGRSLTGIGDIIYSFATTFPWGAVGDKIGNGVNQMFGNINWVAIANGINAAFTGMFDSLLAFIESVDWKHHGDALANGIRSFITGLPTTQFAEALSSSVEAILAIILPTISDPAIWSELGSKFAGFMNGIFNRTEMWTSLRLSLTYALKGVINAITKAVTEFKWAEHGQTFHDNVLELTKDFPATELGDALTKSVKGVLDLIAPTISDPKIWSNIGVRLGAFMNKVFGDTEMWAKVGETANNMLNGVLTFGKSFLARFDARTAAENIKTALGNIGWGEIASNTWDVIKIAFKKTGDFVDTLLTSDNDSDAHWDPWVKRYVSNSGIGTKLGRRISEAIAGIDWKEFGSFLSTGAAKLFNEFSAMLNKLTERGSNNRSALEDAIINFIEGIDKEALAESIKGALEAIANVIAQSFGTLLNKAFDELLSDPLGFVNGYSNLTPSTASDYTMIGDSNSAGKLFGSGRENLFASKGISLADNVADGFTNEMDARKPDISKAMTASFMDPFNIEVEGETGFDVHSPSKRTKKLGEYIAEGLTNGLNAAQIVVTKAMQDIVTLVLQPLNNLADVGVKGATRRTQEYFTDSWNTINSGVQIAMMTFKSLVDTALTDVFNVITTQMSNYNSMFTTSWNTINSGVQIAMMTFKSFVETALDGLNKNTPGVMDSIASTFSSGFSGIASGAAEAMRQMYTSISDAVSSIESELPRRFRNMYNDIINMANGMIGGVESAANSVVNGLNNALQIHLRFDRPDWAGGGSYWWDYSPNMPNVSFGRVSQLASGGILSGPTMLASNILAGEAGREAVLPLDSHTDWMDTLAEHVITQASQSGVNFANGYDTSDYDYAQSNDQELALLREQNRLLQQLVEKDYNLEVTTGQYEKAQRRSNRRAGKMVIAVGT